MTRRFARHLMLAMATTSGLAFTTGAWSQDIAAPAPAPAAEAVAPTAAVEADVPAADAIDPAEIVVTARRRNEALQDTPVAITAINAAALEGKATTNIGDLQGAAPNLLITQQNSGAQAANLSIRGLTYADIEKSQEPTVGVVVDGVFIGTNTGQLLDFFDIQQIEVLRGPQGTLFGRNTIGGVINIQRTRPTMVTGIKAEASYGSYDTWSARAVANFGNGETFGIKGFYFHSQSDGFYKDSVSGDHRGGSNNENFGISALLKPAGTDFDALLTIEKQVQKFDVVNSNIAQDGELFCVFEPANECNRNTTSDLYTVFVTPGTSRYSAPSATLEMNLQAGAVKLTSITGYRESKENQTQDFDASTTDLYYTLREQDYRQFSQEIRAAGNLFDGFDYVIGAYYFSSKYNLQQWTRLFAFNTALDPKLADANSQITSGKSRSAALFGDFNWAFADRFRLSFGGRLTRDRKELVNGFATTGIIGDGKKSFTKFTPKIGIDYRPNEDTMLYASLSRGYRSGGFSPRAGEPATGSLAYNPETVDTVEVGAKLDLLDRTLQFNIAAFASRYKDLQQNTTIPCSCDVGNQTITSNVGSANIKGIEIDATWRPVEGLRLNGTVGILDSKFKDFVAGNTLTVFNPLAPTVPITVIRDFDYSRNNPIYSPKFSASLSGQYKLPTSFGSVVANASYRYIGRYDQQISLGPLTGNTGFVDNGGVVVVNRNDSRVRSDQQNLLDASLTGNFRVGSGDAYVTLFTRNLLNDRGPTAAFTVAGLWSFASAREPRVVGVTIGGKF